MKLSPGFQTTNETRVCYLRTSLYDLRQAPRCWFSKLATALHDYGFRQSKADYSLFSLIRPDVCVQVLVYVDDLIIYGNTPEVIQKFQDYLSSCFHMKDLGVIKYFLGI